MKASLIIKTCIATFLNQLGIPGWRLGGYSLHNSVLLMYHHVLPQGRAEVIQAGMYVEPDAFKAHIRFLKKHFKVVPLRNLFLSTGESCKSDNQPLCFLTFDDGYYDFYEYAFPVLKAHQIPATVFLPTDFIGTRKWFWTDRLTTLFSQRQRAESEERRVRSKNSSSNYLVNQLENLKGSKESKLEKAIQILKAYRDEEIEEILSELSTRWNINPDPADRAFLSWEEVREMAQSGLITFGSHTASHRILTTLKDEEIWEELARSRERLIAEKVVDPSFIPFCYPNGNYDEKIARMVKEAGYSLAVTTENGWNRFGSDPFTLKRIAIHQDISSTEAMFGCRIMNIF